MVTIVNYKSFKNENEEEFFSLVVQGGLEAIKSKETAQVYFTARTAQVTSTFDENTCKSLIGSQIPGKIEKVEVEPYEYLNSQTGELITYTKRNVFIPQGQEEEDEEILKNNLELEKNVI